MKIKLDSTMDPGAADVLGEVARQLYDRRGRAVVGVVELTHDRRLEPAPNSAKEREVTMKVTGLELARDEQEHTLREAMRALYLHRTARGTLNEADEVELSDRTLEMCAGMLHALEAARLKAVIEHYAAIARQAGATSKPLTISELRHELGLIADGLNAAVNGLIEATD